MIAALIIAAGKTAHRDGFEPQKEVGTIPAIQRIVKVFELAGIERIIVICGEEGNKNDKLVAHMNVTFLHCRQNAEMIDNVKIGLSYLQNKCAAVLITHVDVPLFSVKTVRALMDSTEKICIPAYKGNVGHPMLLNADYFDSVMSYYGEGGLFGAVKALNLKCGVIEVEDEGVLMNIHYKNDYESLIEKHSLMDIQPEIKVRLTREKVFYGPGAHQLLQLTEETKSLLEACRKMGISYSKGRSIISTIEQQLGYSVIESRQGGKSGGSSQVTKEGMELMRRYSEFCVAAKQNLNELFYKYFVK